MGYNTYYAGNISIAPTLTLRLAKTINKLQSFTDDEPVTIPYINTYTYIPSFWVAEKSRLYIQDTARGDQDEWLYFIVNGLLKPNGYVCNGEIGCQGEERDDNWRLKVTNNVVAVQNGEFRYNPPRRLTHTKQVDRFYCRLNLNLSHKQCGRCKSRFVCFTET